MIKGLNGNMKERKGVRKKTNENETEEEKQMKEKTNYGTSAERYA